jgi:hypothetical protein
MEGPTGEARLVQMLDSLAGAKKVMAVAALGDAQGDQGSAALRGLLAVPQRSVDLRCAALLALAKRDGADASDVLAAHLTQHQILGQQLDRPPPARQPQQLTPGLA